MSVNRLDCLLQIIENWFSSDVSIVVTSEGKREDYNGKKCFDNTNATLPLTPVPTSPVMSNGPTPEIVSKTISVSNDKVLIKYFYVTLWQIKLFSNIRKRFKFNGMCVCRYHEESLCWLRRHKSMRLESCLFKVFLRSRSVMFFLCLWVCTWLLCTFRITVLRLLRERGSSRLELFISTVSFR